MTLQFYNPINERAVPIVPLMELKERRQKRGYEKEAKKVEQYLIDIETKFEFSVFEAPKEISYKALYDYFLDIWQTCVRNFLIVNDFKYIAIDVHHFAKKYRPQI